jgi:DNA repair exonuclease SbcCD ATPase subunit
MLLWLKTYASTHITYIVIFVMAFAFWRAWITQHDNAIRADLQVKISEADVKARDARIADLLKEKDADRAFANEQMAVLEQQLAGVKTRLDALKVIQQLAPAVHPVESPTDPTSVTVEAIPLAQELTQCRIDRIDLGACKKNLEQTEQIAEERKAQIKDKNDEITMLKKPQGFWKKVGSKLKDVGTGIGIGIGIGLGLAR